MALFSQLGNYKNFGTLVMRAGLGAMMVIHGLPKITGGPEKWEQLGHAMGNLNIHFVPVFWGFMSAVTETIGGLFCVLGLWFRLISVLLTINMIVAAVSQFAGGDSVATASHAIELAFVFFGFIFLGPGVYSVDKG